MERTWGQTLPRKTINLQNQQQMIDKQMQTEPVKYDLDPDHILQLIKECEQDTSFIQFVDMVESILKQRAVFYSILLAPSGEATNSFQNSSMASK